MSGAFREDAFLEAFEEAGFYGLEILSRQSEPWAIVEGIEFRSMTVQAWKGKEGPCLERKQAVVYQGPWKSVTDDNGQQFLRGKRMAVCDKTFQMFKSAPYAKDITAIAPTHEVPLNSAATFNCSKTTIRSAAETKQGQGLLNLLPGSDCCSDDGTCC